MQTTILNKLISLLESNPDLVVEGSLNKNKVAELARKYDAELLNLLQKDGEVKKHFFSNTDAGLVFKKDVLLQFISNKEFLPDSFTKYKIKIGLGSNDGSLLSESGEVVLNWPYKDATLEGGQEKEEGKRNEVFFNEVLAPDQITRLLDDKVFTNWKRYNHLGEVPLDNLNDDDNLIIKGNNLVVLHSLKKRFAGKVKLVYIDPPYNTGNDSFGYNDRFNHSTWLTFMKNRLEVARELLSDDGSIFVHIDWNENHYVKVLMDEVFGRDNFINEIVWKRRGGSMNQPNCFGNVVDYILMYSKTSRYTFKPAKTLEDDNTQKYIKERFIYKESDGRIYMKSPLVSPKDRPNLKYEFMGYKAPKNGWLVSQDKMKRWYDEDRLVLPEDKGKRISRKIYLDEYEGQPVNCLWQDIYVINPMSLEAMQFIGQKPEALLERILDVTTEPGDTVLDYHLGSGTTAAVAHKMGRQYIGVEQLYYGENDPTVRLKNVIDGDQTGISKSVGWKGGGSFVYMNIMNNANKFRETVQRAGTDKELVELLDEALSSSFLSYRVDPKKFDSNQFTKLSTVEKKRLLVELVDNNTLYVNYDDINDGAYKVSNADKQFNEDFYKNQDK